MKDKESKDLEKLERECIEEIKKVIEESFNDVAQMKGWEKSKSKEENK